MKILVMGLPGSGKTYLAERLQPLLESAWFNADKVRSMAGDWDFSEEGRLRQSLRMKSIADFESHHNRICLLYTSPSPRDKRQYRMPSSA